MSSFKEIVLAAKDGNSEAMKKLLLICKDALDAGSKIKGEENAELKELIYYRFVQAVYRFKI